MAHSNTGSLIRSRQQNIFPVKMNNVIFIWDKSYIDHLLSSKSIENVVYYAEVKNIQKIHQN